MSSNRAYRQALAGSRASDGQTDGRRAVLRIPAGTKLLLCMALSILAFGARTPTHLACLTAADLLLLLLLRAGANAVWREGRRVFVWQTGIIVGLYLIRFGLEGLWPGFRTSWQLFMAFLPGMIFLQSTPQPRIVETLMRVLPHKTAFVLAISIRFIPLVLREVRSIHEAQVLRGAKILPRDLLRPWNWGDLIHCLLVPVIVQSLVLSGEIARAARARDFGIEDRRTCWPGA